MADQKFHHIPNGIDLSEWSGDTGLPEQHANKLRELKEKGVFIVMYAGAHGIANALPSLVQAADMLKHEPVCFVLVGQGPEKSHLQDLADERRLSNVVFLPPVAKTSVPELLSQADVLYIGLKREPLFRFGISPNKLMDYLMAGKPVIQAIDAGNDIVTDSRSGITIAPENPQQFADAVRTLMEKSVAEREQMGSNGKVYVMHNHDYRILAQRFLNIIREPAA